MKKYYLLFCIILLFVSGCSNYFGEQDQSLKIISDFKKDLGISENILPGDFFFKVGGLYYKGTGNVLNFEDNIELTKPFESFSQFQESKINQKYEILFKSLMRKYKLEFDYENSSKMSDAENIIYGYMMSEGYNITYSNKRYICTYLNQIEGKDNNYNHSVDLQTIIKFLGYKSNIKISCIKNEDMERNIKAQKEFVEQTNIKNRWQITSTYEIGTYTYYEINLEYIRALVRKDEKGNYLTIEEGNSDYSCDIMEEYNIPKYIYKECL